MKAEFTSFNSDSNWVEGTVDKYQFQAKLFDIGSNHGINNGRVSKLTIWNEKSNVHIVHYSRGWDIKPKAEYKEYFNAVMELLENSPKRFE